MSNTMIDGVDFGPLAFLPGLWKGEKGMDIAPESDGSTEENPFHEEILFEVVGDVTNAGKQTLAVIRYHQKVYRKSDNQQFHDQIGYWIWDVRALVLDRLNRPDGATELHPLLRVLDRHVHAALGPTDLLRGEGDGGQVENA